ncbi:hypothetical protein [Nocardia camponoti]|uniref:Uncharacterized protein n=1 Tax=Nocardia camponoti TaxID=1616106 RepID=A0A917QBV3_9NOCA|nr:hypothetical protein [Nocardia camponoti]GGK43296.1 hypothetical protein GCM10011591_13700 [Nocardia camponoti]
MTATPRSAAESVTVFIATSVAVLSIMLPLSFSNLGSFVHVDLLVFNIPRVMSAAAFVAVTTAAVLVAASSTRAALWTALLGQAGILFNHLVILPISDRSHFTGLSLPTLNFIDALLAGAVVGAIAVAVWRDRVQRGVYLFAMVGATVLGDLTETPTDGDNDGFDSVLGGTLPLWFVGASVLALGYFAATSGATHAITDDAIPLAPVFAAVILFSTILVSALAIAADKDSALTLVIGGVATVLAATAAAFILPGRDGVLLLLMTSFSVAGSLVVTLPRPGWVDGATLIFVGVGLYAGLHWRRPSAAAACVTVMAALTLASDTSFRATPGAVAVIGCMGLGAAVGYCVGTGLPADPASGVVGLVVLFVPSLGVALADPDVDQLAYSESWYRAIGHERGPVPATVAMCVAIGCSLAIALLVRVRPAPVDPYGA